MSYGYSYPNQPIRYYPVPQITQNTTYLVNNSLVERRRDDYPAQRLEQTSNILKSSQEVGRENHASKDIRALNSREMIQSYEGKDKNNPSYNKQEHINYNRLSEGTRKNSDQFFKSSFSEYRSPDSRENYEKNNRFENRIKDEERNGQYHGMRESPFQRPYKESRSPLIKKEPLNSKGLKNHGNSCYRNVVFQTLFHLPLFRDFILEEEKSSRHDNLFTRFKEFLIYMKSQSTSFYEKYEKERAFYLYVGQILNNFDNLEEHDAHDFMISFLEEIHQNKNPKKLIKRPIKNPQSSEEFLENEKNYDNSFVYDIFGGVFLNEFTCSKCNYKLKKFERFLDLSLCFPQRNQKNSTPLEDLMKEFYEYYETIELKCEKCSPKGNVHFRKEISLEILPQVLFIHLKRFSFENRRTLKNRTSIEFPISNFHMKATRTENKKVYDLKAVVYHIGDSNQGHYVCDCKNDLGKWKRYNDEKVTEINEKDIATNTEHPYILIYSSQNQSQFMY